MQKASEWLLSFNSNPNTQIQSMLKQKRDHPSSTIKGSITGGKGGVGKTSISLKMATELSKVGFKVLLIDCDYNLSNTAINLGLPIEKPKNPPHTPPRICANCEILSD